MSAFDTEAFRSALVREIRRAGVELDRDVADAIGNAAEQETGPAERVLCHIVENLAIAREKNLPMCQDTGMVWMLAECGEEADLPPGLGGILNDAVETAYREGYFRQSVVADPLNGRKNTGNNLPPVIHWRRVPGAGLKVSFLLKGFGSENCSRIHMLKPTAGREAVVEAVAGTIAAVGGAPCPPVVLGVGIGGTLDHAALMSKEALLRDLSDVHPDPYYRDLERDLTDAVNDLGIGGGGLGGRITCLGVKVRSAPTHIAGLPVAVSVNCWADRKGTVSWNGEEVV